MFVCYKRNIVRLVVLNKMKKYQQINTKKKYNKILNSGVFFESYPELTGNYGADKEIIKIIEIIETTIQDKRITYGFMPRIKQFVCEYGYIYDVSSKEILIEMVEGYTKYYVIDDDFNRNYLKPEIYVN